MACMEHECRACGATVFNNHGSGGKCQKCGGYDWRSTWDEADDHARDAADRDREPEPEPDDDDEPEDDDE